MFGLFAPRCPLQTLDKLWVERRMFWLVERFGADRLLNVPVVTPTETFFPDPYDRDEESVRKCFVRMCGYMGIDPLSVTLRIVQDEQMPGAAGLYEMRARSVVRVASSQLSQPPRLLATIAHELAHELLLKGGHLTHDTTDHEQVTDLLPVFLGVGIFGANATVDSAAWTDGQMSMFSISKQGYLSSIVLGYAHALFAYLRGEYRPAWVTHLRTDAAATLWAALRYLRKTGDSLVTPDTLGNPRPRPSPSTTAEQLRHPSPTFRAAALWDIADYAFRDPELLPEVVACLDDRDNDVRCEAVRTLGTFGAGARVSIPKLIQAAWYGSPLFRVAAIGALGEMETDPERVVPGLVTVLGDQDKDVVVAAADALARYGRAANAAEEPLLTALERAAAVTDYDTTSRLITALMAVCDDPKQHIERYFALRDPDVRRLVLGVLRDRGM